MSIMKTLTAGLTALALTLTAPTQAAAELSERDRQALAGGIAALLVLGLIAKSHDRNSSSGSSGSSGGSGGGGGGGGGHVPVIVTPQSHVTVPASCVVTAQLQGGRQVGVIGRPCLNRSGFTRFDRLPSACERTVRLGNGRLVDSWAVPCLRRSGVRVH